MTTFFRCIPRKGKAVSDDFAYIKYDLIPEHMRESVRGYLEFGWRPGGFLRAVLANDLAHSYRNADSINRAAMPQWAEWLYWECPEPAWGSEQRVDEWCQRRRRLLEATESKQEGKAT